MNPLGATGGDNAASGLADGREEQSRGDEEVWHYDGVKRGRNNGPCGLQFESLSQTPC